MKGKESINASDLLLEQEEIYYTYQNKPWSQEDTDPSSRLCDCMVPVSACFTLSKWSLKVAREGSSRW